MAISAVYESSVSSDEFEPFPTDDFTSGDPPG